MSYRLTLIPRAARDLELLETNLFNQVTRAIRALAEKPRPPGALKLSEPESGYRVRVRDFRILYRVDDRRREIVIYRIRHRREAYR